MNKLKKMLLILTATISSCFIVKTKSYAMFDKVIAKMIDFGTEKGGKNNINNATNKNENRINIINKDDKINKKFNINNAIDDNKNEISSNNYNIQNDTQAKTKKNLNKLFPQNLISDYKIINDDENNSNKQFNINIDNNENENRINIINEEYNGEESKSEDQYLYKFYKDEQLSNIEQEKYNIANSFTYCLLEDPDIAKDVQEQLGWSMQYIAYKYFGDLFKYMAEDSNIGIGLDFDSFSSWMEDAASDKASELLENIKNIADRCVYNCTNHKPSKYYFKIFIKNLSKHFTDKKRLDDALEYITKQIIDNYVQKYYVLIQNLLIDSDPEIIKNFVLSCLFTIDKVSCGSFYTNCNYESRYFGFFDNNSTEKIPLFFDSVGFYSFLWADSFANEPFLYNFKVDPSIVGSEDDRKVLEDKRLYQYTQMAYEVFENCVQKYDELKEIHLHISPESFMADDELKLLNGKDPDLEVSFLNMVRFMYSSINSSTIPSMVMSVLSETILTYVKRAIEPDSDNDKLSNLTKSLSRNLSTTDINKFKRSPSVTDINKLIKRSPSAANFFNKKPLNTENKNEINNGTSEFNTIKEENNEGDIDKKSGNDN